MDKIIIKDLLIQAIIGVNKGERKKKTKYKIKYYNVL
jgi:dihydroneopterin aldolase